jgi:hypothetical protein
MKLKFQKKYVAGLHKDKKNIFQEEGYQLERL